MAPEHREVTELEQLVQFYGQRILEALQLLLKREEKGLRIREATGRLQTMTTVQWNDGKRAILDRLSVAENGCTSRDLIAYLQANGHERFANNLARANLKRKSPLRELMAQQLIVRTAKSRTAPPVYWSRAMYLRRYAQLPFDYQQAAVEAAIAQKADNE